MVARLRAVDENCTGLLVAAIVAEKVGWLVKLFDYYQGVVVFRLVQFISVHFIGRAGSRCVGP